MLLLTRSEIASLLKFDDYLNAVENAFRLHADGQSLNPALAHVDAVGGEFHIKAGGLQGETPYFALKVNGGFFTNRARFGLPNIQGLIVLSRADNGVPLAVMDSAEITIQRTGAATAAAAKLLARPNSRTCMVAGTGIQARIQLHALKRVLPLEKAFVWSRTREKSVWFGWEMSRELGIPVFTVNELAEAAAQSDVCVTCTPSKRPFFTRNLLRPGMFLAAVGADSPDKQEFEAEAVASCTVFADLRDQAIHVGETHHAIAAGLFRPEQIAGELGEVIAGRKPGRTSEEEVILFDSTGTALQDVAAAALAYERALQAGTGREWTPSS